MPFSLTVQVRDPARKVGRQTAPVEGVTVQAGPPPEDTDAQPGDLDPDAVLDLPVTEAGPGAFHVEVPDPGKVLVRLTRDGHPPLQVPLHLGASKPFPYERPLIMRLARTGAQKRGTERVVRFNLVVDLHAEPQELLMCSGHDAMFHPAAGWRLAWLIQRRRAHRSCLLTRYRYESEPGLELKIETRLARTTGVTRGPAEKTALLTSKTVTVDEDISALTFYEYLARVGRERPGTIREVGFINHAYWMGPVLVSTRRKDDDCTGLCPVHGGRHTSRTCDVPRAFTDHFHWWGEELPKGGAKMIEVGVILRELRYESDADPKLKWTNWKKESDPGHRRDFDKKQLPRRATLLDRDPRNTDFCHPTMLEKAGEEGAPPKVPLEDMRAALHADAELRVWGCSNGSLGGLFRAAYQKAKQRPRAKNRMLRVFYWYIHDDHKLLHTWDVRQRDLELIYLSNLRRSYPQAIATGLGRPCYGAIPGTWAWFKEREATGGLVVHRGVHSVISPLARRMANIGQPAPGRYYRFEPNYWETQKTKVEVTVLVTGFVPFRDPDERDFPLTNGAAEAVKGVQEFDIEWGAQVPPWIELDVKLVKETGVDVVWTCPAPRTQHPPEHPPGNRPEFNVKGSQGILDRAKEVDADIVVIVGESASMARKKDGKKLHVRMELFAENKGKGYDPAVGMVDNDGYALDHDGPIFPGEPETLRTTVPQQAWALAQSALKNVVWLNPEEFRTRPPLGSTGAFVCNESYYRLLLDAQQTGRWVSMVHVPSTEYTENGVRVVEEELSEFRFQVSYALQTLIGAFVEQMLWATQTPGRLRGERAEEHLAQVRGGVFA